MTFASSGLQRINGSSKCIARTSFVPLCFGILVFANFEIGFLKGQDPPSISHSNFDGGKLTVERGLTGIYSFSYFGKRLQAKSERNADPPVGLRLTSSGDDRNRYVLKFVGYREGLFDLGNLIEHVDGSAALDLPKLELNVVSMLPKDQRSDLFEAANFKPNLWGGYRWGLGLLSLVWLSVPILIWIRNALQVKPEKVVVVEEPIPTFAEQIRPLVEAAAARTLSAREKGSLELLLLHFWRERASLHDSDMVSAIRQLRAHPDAGNLLSSVERWLHQSDGAHDARDRSPEAIVELLKPYAEMAAISTPIKGFAMGQGSATVSKDPQSNARSAAR